MKFKENGLETTSRGHPRYSNIFYDSVMIYFIGNSDISIWWRKYEIPHSSSWTIPAMTILRHNYPLEACTLVTL